MEIRQALKLAIEVLRKERQNLAFDANVLRSYGTGTPTMQKKAQRYNELGEAIKVIQEKMEYGKDAGL